MNDIIIIGGGLSSLICANLLIKDGYKCTILEKNNKLGGREKLGSINISLDKSHLIDLNKLKNINYKFDNFELEPNINAIEDRVKSLSISDYELIKDFFKNISKVSKDILNRDDYEFNVSDKSLGKLIKRSKEVSSINYVIKKYKVSIYEYFSKCSNEKVKGLFLNILPGYFPLSYLILYLSEYINKVLYDISFDYDNIIKDLVDKFLKNEGRILYNKEVKKLVIKDGRVNHLLLDSNDTIYGDLFISGVEINSFAQEMLEKKDAKKLDPKYEVLKTSILDYPSRCNLVYYYTYKGLINECFNTTHIIKIDPFKIGSSEITYIHLTYSKDKLIAYFDLTSNEYMYFKVLSRKKAMYQDFIESIGDKIKGYIDNYLNDLGFISKTKLDSFLSPITIEDRYNRTYGATISFNPKKITNDLALDNTLRGLSNLYLATGSIHVGRENDSDIVSAYNAYYLIKKTNE